MKDLTWGESIAVRKAFLETSKMNIVMISRTQLEAMGYSDNNLESPLVLTTKQVIKRQTGIDYKHVLLTNGATGGVVISLRAMAQRGKKTAYTLPPPFYPRYGIMIKAAGLTHAHSTLIENTIEPVHLIDSPSNPLGLIDAGPKLQYYDNPVSTVWDAIYHNRVYMDIHQDHPEHDIMVGSYSKLTGINGLRAGWVATNDTLLFERLKTLVLAEYCGLSEPGTLVLNSLLEGFQWPEFEKLARMHLDDNREEWQRLERYFDGWTVSPYGMFHYSKVDLAFRRLLEKADISYLKGSDVGTDDSFGRFNIGQDRELIRDAVKDILKQDRSK